MLLSVTALGCADQPAQNSAATDFFTLSMTQTTEANDTFGGFMLELKNVSGQDLTIVTDTNLFQGTLVLQTSDSEYRVFHETFRNMILSATWINPRLDFKKKATISWQLASEDLKTLHGTPIEQVPGLRGSTVFARFEFLSVAGNAKFDPHCTSQKIEIK